MTYKTILANFSNEDHAQRTIEIASDLAVEHGAHLIGLYVVPAVRVYPPIAAEIPIDILERQHAGYRAIADRIEQTFEEITSNQGVSAEWRTVDATSPDRAATVLEHCRAADLVVLSQRSQDETYGEQPVEQRVVLGTGCPVLLLPNTGDVGPIGKHIFVAWDGGREAARAAHDALPILVSSTQTFLHRIDPPAEADHDVTAVGAGLATALARHGVNIETSSSNTHSLSVGEEILSEARGRGCDLIVMGAYGHSRMREMVFGGATRYMFDQAPVPVLMSH